MARTKSRTIVEGSTEVEYEKLRKIGTFLGFKVEWWEIVATKHVGNDIHIETSNPIRAIYLNGKKFETNPLPE